jgi:hypothetical protein
VPGQTDFSNRPTIEVRTPQKVALLIPGAALCAAVTLVAVALQPVEQATLGHP